MHAAAMATTSLPETGWQPLPARARWLFALSRAWFALPMLFVGFVLWQIFAVPGLIAALCGALLLGLGGVWIGLRQFRHIAWRLDEDGLAIRRGRMFQRETRVPATRVQHLDLKRGPLQRQRNLATLIVHTAGTRHSAVTLPHLDEDDAERLRDVLARQIDIEDDESLP